MASVSLPITWLIKAGPRKAAIWHEVNDAMRLQTRKSEISRCQEVECIVMYELIQADRNKNIDACKN